MTAKQKPAGSTAVAWRRALKAVGVNTRGLHVRTVYRCGSYRLGDKRVRYSTRLFKTLHVDQRQGDLQLLIGAAGEFAALVAAMGWRAHVVLYDADGKYPYIDITTKDLQLPSTARLLATTEADDGE